MPAASSLSKLMKAVQPPPPLLSKPDPEPGCPYGLLVGARLEEIRTDVNELRDLTRWLLRLMAGLILTAIATTVIRVLIP